MIEIVPEIPAEHAVAIEALYDRTFGPGHFAKTAERLREGTMSLPKLSRVGLKEGRVIGVTRLWPVEIGTTRQAAVFVGPVAVDPDFQGQRIGLSITGEALEAATRAGWQAAVIIGAPAYFGELGFKQVAAGTLAFPGPQEADRIMIRDLAGDAEALSGLVRVPVDPKSYA